MKLTKSNLTRLKNENENLRYIVYNLIEFTEIPEIKDAIDGAYDPTIYVDWGKQIINYEKLSTMQ